MSDRSKSKLFWQGTSGSLAAKLTEKREQKRLAGEMASARIQAKYAELKAKRKARHNSQGPDRV